MSSEHWTKLRSLFEHALDVPETERGDWVAAHTVDDVQLRTELIALLREEDTPGGVLSYAARSAFKTWDVDALVGRELAGYRIERLLAFGGMGVVYIARQRTPDRLVALKTLRSPDVSADAQRRFQLEVEVLGRLQHHGIAQVFDGGTLDIDGNRVPYLAMELVHAARDVVTYAREEGLDLRARVALFRQIAAAVHEGHRLGIVHRDLKPANLLVDGTGHPKVIDFGLARVLDSEALGLSSLQTIEGRILGTLDYMSPEHVTGTSRDVDVRSDVYSLGCVLSELLAGRPPRVLQGLSLAQAVLRIEQQPVPVPRELPRPLRAILATALAHEPDERYPSAATLDADLGRWLAGESVAAQRAHALLLVSAFSRRHRALLFGSLAVSAALAIGLALAKSEASRAERASEEARREAVTALAVGDFLARMTNSVNAYRAGRDAKIVDLLASGEEDVTGVEDPRARAVVQSVIGQGFMNLGDLARARPLIDASAAALAQLVPEDDESRLRAEAARADILEQVGDYAGALALTERTLPLAVERAGAASHLARYLRTNLGVCYERLGRFAEAEGAYREQLAIMEAHALGEPHTTSDMHQKIAATRISRGDLPGARAELQVAQALLLGNGLAGSLDANNNKMTLASIDMHEGHLDAALVGYQAALEGFRARGGSSSNILSAEVNTAQCLLSLQRLDDARAQLAEAAELARELEPEPGRWTHAILVTRARADFLADDFAAARANAEAALRLGAALVPSGHPNECLSRRLLAQAEARSGEVDRALETLRAGEVTAAALYGPTSDELLSLRRHGVNHLVEAGRQMEADAWARATLALLPPDAPDAVRAHWRADLVDVGAHLDPD